MLDALGPFVESLEAAVSDGTDWRAAWSASVEVAQTSAAEAAELRPKVGRARPLAERSVGTPDAGAISLAMCAHVVAELIEERRR
jgi:dihydroxyacetone kinase